MTKVVSVDDKSSRIGVSEARVDCRFRSRFTELAETPNRAVWLAGGIFNNESLATPSTLSFLPCAENDTIVEYSPTIKLL